MKRLYNKPVLEVENFFTEEIMDNVKPENVLSYDSINGIGGYGSDPNDSGFIRFQTNDGNVLNSIDYSTFNN